MRIPRIHVAQPMQPGCLIDLPLQAGEHIARVLRLEAGHPLRLFDGVGGECAAELASVTKRSVSARVLHPVDAPNRESPLRITLAQSIARGDKMDWILQKATELGVACIVPLLTERTEVKLGPDRAERRVAHWRAVVVSACEQCGRSRLPQLVEPIRLHEWTMVLGVADGLRLTLDPGGRVAARELSITTDEATLAIGPEGGFSRHDLAALEQAGFRAMRLGPRILRTETAGIAALAALQAIHGDL